LTKPTDAERLVRAIDSAMERHEKVRAVSVSTQFARALLERAAAAIVEALTLRLENQVQQMRGRQCISRMIDSNLEALPFSRSFSSSVFSRPLTKVWVGVLSR
jgi:hypothetical protein